MLSPEDRWERARKGAVASVDRGGDEQRWEVFIRTAFLRELREAIAESRAEEREKCITEARRTCHQLAGLCREHTSQASCAYRDAAQQIETNIRHCMKDEIATSSPPDLEKRVAELEARFQRHRLEEDTLAKRVARLESWRSQAGLPLTDR
jgi:hypothetical protein